MTQYTYYYEELSMPYIYKVMRELEKRMEDGSAELTLKNGLEILVGKKPNGDIQIYDEELNLIAECDNTGEAALKPALFDAAVFIIRASKRSDLW